MELRRCTHHRRKNRIWMISFLPAANCKRWWLHLLQGVRPAGWKAMGNLRRGAGRSYKAALDKSKNKATLFSKTCHTNMMMHRWWRGRRSMAWLEWVFWEFRSPNLRMSILKDPVEHPFYGRWSEKDLDHNVLKLWVCGLLLYSYIRLVGSHYRLVTRYSVSSHANVVWLSGWIVTISAVTGSKWVWNFKLILEKSLSQVQL